MKILIIEDDAIMHKSLRNGLKKLGYATDSAYDGDEAVDLFMLYQYDAVILDLNLPKKDGIEVLNIIRKNNTELAVLILSARSELEDKITGFDGGANDYLTKPFHFRELDARLRSLLRRKFMQNDTVVTHGGVTIDTAKKTVFVSGIQIILTKKEYGILEHLMQNKDRIVSRDEFLDHIWDSDADLFDSTVKVHIYSLKKKLSALLGDDEFIKNSRGLGYFLAGEDKTDA